MKKIVTLALLIGSFSMMSCAPATQDSHDHAATSATWQTMTFKQDVPIIQGLSDDDDELREHGEMMFFEALMRDTTGQVTAQLIGMMTIVDIPGEDIIGNPVMEERFTHMAIIFPDGDKITITGANIYPMKERLMQADIPQHRVITGGTGKYKGIRGEISTTRNEDQTYHHVLEYRLD
jgi:hypothetical protein